MDYPNVRQPALRVLLNGSSLPEVYEVEVEANAYLSADRFSMRAAMSPANSGLLTNTAISIEIQVCLDAGWQTLIIGNADCLELDPIRGDIFLCGRDLSSVFIGSQTSETYENLTASEVAVLLAQRHGLASEVVPTSTLIGRYYRRGYTRSAMSQYGRATTEWDVLTSLAQLEGFDVWVNQATLHFGPPNINSLAYRVSPGNCIDMTLCRDLTIAGGISLEIRSWNSAFQESTVSRASYNSDGLGRTEIVALRPNLSSLDGQALAQRMLTQLCSHERSIEFTLPADTFTAPRNYVQLTGTNGDFDGEYFIYEVERHFSSTHGFTQHVKARRASWIVS